MDFHSLPRRTLQQLCKRNKIPANITNIAMAESLHSLQMSQTTPIKKSPTRPPNQPRSCRRNASPIASSVSKRRRVKKLEDDKDEEEDPLEKMSTLSSLVRCNDRSACCKTHRKETRTQAVRQNANVTLDSRESVVGVAVGYAQVKDEKRRSIGVQVDAEDIDNNVLVEIEANRCVDLIKEDQETNPCGIPIDSLHLQNLQVASLLLEPNPNSTNLTSGVRDHVSNASLVDAALNHVPILEKNEVEGVKSNGDHVPHPCNEDIALDHVPLVEIDGNELGESVGIESKNVEGNDMGKENEVARTDGGMQAEMKTTKQNENNDMKKDFDEGDDMDEENEEGKIDGDPLPNPGIKDIAFDHVPILENDKVELGGSVGIQSKNIEVDGMDRENEVVRGDGGMQVEIKTEKQSKKKKKDLDGLSLRKLRVLYKKNEEVIKLEKTIGEVPREGEVKCEEKKLMLDGLSLRKLKLLYKDKVTRQQE